MPRIGVAQICSTGNITQNLKKCIDFIEKAVEKNVRVLFFPEATDYIARGSEESIALAASVEKEFVEPLRTYIKSMEAAIDVSVGVHLPTQDLKVDHRVRNCLLYINNEGKIISEYQKLHTFDVPFSNLFESKTVQPGAKEPVPFKTPVGILGPSICYDIRFPEQALHLRSKGAQVICYPSAFTVKTGEAHWELLGRCRATETQTYVVMPGQCGKHNEKRESYGHSFIAGPWGNIMAQASRDKEDLITADIDLNELEKVRKGMPLWDQRLAETFSDFPSAEVDPLTIA